jgi:hypothetical protein
MAVTDDDPLSPTWCGYEWTPWRPLASPDAPAASGVYRVRFGRRGLAYVGQSRNLKARLYALS